MPQQKLITTRQCTNNRTLHPESMQRSHKDGKRQISWKRTREHVPKKSWKTNSSHNGGQKINYPILLHSTLQNRNTSSQLSRCSPSGITWKRFYYNSLSAYSTLVNLIVTSVTWAIFKNDSMIDWLIISFRTTVNTLWVIMKMHISSTVWTHAHNRLSSTP